MPANWYMYLVAALIPMVVGAIYYHPKVLGSYWMNLNGFTEETLKKGNPLVIFGVAYLFSCFLCLALTPVFIHQHGVASSAMSPDAPGTWTPQAIQDVNNFMSAYGSYYRSFGHGAVHGLLASVLIALPLFGINSLFERRSWKYNLLHWGYWAITLMLIGAVLCGTLEWPPLG